MTNQDRLDQLIEAVTVDCYNASEQATAFHAVFSEEVRLPTAASLLGAAVTVREIDVGNDGQSLLARCASGPSNGGSRLPIWSSLRMRSQLGFTPATDGHSA